MKTKELSIFIEGLRKLSEDAAALAAVLERDEAPEPEPAKVYTLEEVRGILADKARSGHRAEVKAILTKHGVKQLSDITSPEELAAVVAEAEVIGND